MSLLVEPVYFSSLIVGGSCPYSEVALRRAVIERANGFDDDDEHYRPLRLARSTLEFDHAKHRLAADCKPCPSSVVWWEDDDGIDVSGG